MLRLRVSERGGNLAARGAPDQTRHLRVDVDGRETSPREDVVKVDGAVIGAATGGEEAALPGAESDGFDGSGVEPLVTLGAFGDDRGAELARYDSGVCDRLTRLAKKGGKRGERAAGQEGGRGAGAAVGGRMAMGGNSDVGVVWPGDTTRNEAGEAETVEEGLKMTPGWRSGDWKGFGMIFEKFVRLKEIASIIVGAGGEEVSLQ